MIPASVPNRSSRPQDGPIRVLVVDDSPAQRGMLVAMLGSDPSLQVIGWASDGAEAIRAAARLKPDVITMDLRMPVMDGLEASRRIMRETPTPIVIVTASAAVEDQRVLFDALQAGVLAIVGKPSDLGATAPAVKELLGTVKNMARVKVVRRWTSQPPPPELPAPWMKLQGPRRHEVVAVGASTGGPQALGEVLAQLPADFPLPILVVQHIALGFVAGLVEWLRSQCRLPIWLAEDGQRLVAPGVYVAPGGKHLLVRGRDIRLSEDPLVSGHRPSATVLFRAIAREYGAGAIGVLLSGMGDDGAAGLRDLKRAGGVTIAQDQESSVVFSMPEVAISMGVVDHVLAPERIGVLLGGIASREAAGL